MPATYSSLYYHVIFSTKGRVPSIEPEWRDALHAYLAGTLRAAGAGEVLVGGIEDHVHLLAALKPVHRIADVVRELKKSSSKWVHTEAARPMFAWQEGYGVFSVGSDGLPELRRYIANQVVHHRKVSSQDELLALCREAGVEVDRRFFE